MSCSAWQIRLTKQNICLQKMPHCVIIIKNEEQIMTEKKRITIIDKKQIPAEEPARQYYFMEIARQYVAELAAQKGSPLTFCVTTFGCPTV